MGKRTQPYRLGFPAKYVDKSQGKSDTKSTTAEAVALLKRGQEAAKKGEKLPDSYFKARVAKKGAKVSRKALNASVKKTLQAKAKKSGISYGTLVKVYRRGQGAWLSGGSRRGASMAAWAMGRVNSYIRGSRKHDTDLR